MNLILYLIAIVGTLLFVYRDEIIIINLIPVLVTIGTLGTILIFTFTSLEESF